MIKNLNIEIQNGAKCKVVFTGEGNVKYNRYLSYTELLSMLNAATVKNSSDRVEIGYCSDILPSDSIISTLAVKEIKSSNSVWYLLLRENVPHDMKYRKRTYKNVGMPKMIFAIKIYNNRCAKMGVSVVKDSHVSSNTKIYEYPFSNVFGPTSVCLGGNSISTFDLVDTTSIRYIPDMFLSMPNNNDGFRKQRSGGLEYGDFLEQLENNEFNEDLLIDTNMTLKDLIDQLR